MHDKDLIHLDIKLDNILITEDNVCKLADFGLVFDLNSGDYSRAIEGDSRYVAPELMNERFCKANDVFSLGIAMLELACNLQLPANGILWQQLRNGIFPEDIMKCEYLFFVFFFKSLIDFSLIAWFRSFKRTPICHKMDDESKTRRSSYSRHPFGTSNNPENH